MVGGYNRICDYRIAGYIGRNNVWRIAIIEKKIAIGGYKFGGYDTIATTFLAVGDPFKR